MRFKRILFFFFFVAHSPLRSAARKPHPSGADVHPKGAHLMRVCAILTRSRARAGLIVRLFFAWRDLASLRSLRFGCMCVREFFKRTLRPTCNMPKTFNWTKLAQLVIPDELPCFDLTQIRMRILQFYKGLFESISLLFA